MIGRRSFITGLVSLVAAPAIVRAASLMPVKSVSLRSVITPSEVNIDLYGRGPMMLALPELRRQINRKFLVPPEFLQSLWEAGYR